MRRIGPQGHPVHHRHAHTFIGMQSYSGGLKHFPACYDPYVEVACARLQIAYGFLPCMWLWWGQVLLNSVGVYVGLMGARSAHTLQPQVNSSYTHPCTSHRDILSFPMLMLSLSHAAHVPPIPRPLTCRAWSVCLCTCLQAARSYFLGLCGVGSLWILLRIVWVRPLPLPPFSCHATPSPFSHHSSLPSP